MMKNVAIAAFAAVAGARKTTWEDLASKEYTYGS